MGGGGATLDIANVPGQAPASARDPPDPVDQVSV
jgi:hypothetical protein